MPKKKEAMHVKKKARPQRKATSLELGSLLGEKGGLLSEILVETPHAEIKPSAKPAEILTLPPKAVKQAVAPKAEKVIDSYGQVEIVSIAGEVLPMYRLKLPELTKQELKLLDAAKDKAIEEIKIDPSKIPDPAERQRVFTHEVLKIIERESKGMHLSPDRLKRLGEAAVRDMIGYGQLDPMIADDQLEDILVTSVNKPVYVYHRRHGMCFTNITFEDENSIKYLIDKMARVVGRRIDQQTPLLDARLPDGSRVNATIPPVSLEGPTLSIRKFRKDPLTVIDILNFNTMSTDVAAFIWLIVDGLGTKPANILFAGGTGCGKTTMLNAATTFVPERERIISIEDTAELQLPHKHWIRLETRPPNVEGRGEICMYPNSYFVDAEGVLREISEFTENLLKKKEVKKDDVLATDGNGYSALCGDPLKLNYRPDRILDACKIMNRKYLCTIECEDGTELRITENTKIPIINNSKKIELLTPSEINPRECFLPVFTKIDISGRVQRINVFDVFDSSKFYACKLSHVFEAIMRELLSKGYTKRAIARRLGLTRQSLPWYTETGDVRMDVLKKLVLLSEKFELQEIESQVKYVRAGGPTSRPIKVPKVVNKNLAYFVGFVLAEKTISGNNLVITQKRDISSIYLHLCKKLFDVEPSVEKRGDYHYFTVTSKVITHLLRTVFGVGKSADARAPEIIMKSPNQIAAAFLAGLIDGDGGVRNGRIYVCTGSERLAKEVVYLFTRLGVKSRTNLNKNVERFSYNPEYTVNVLSRVDIVNACKQIPFRINRSQAEANKKHKYSFALKRHRVPTRVINPILQNLARCLTISEKKRLIYPYRNTQGTMPKSKLIELSKIVKSSKRDVPKVLELLTRKDLEFVKIKRIRIEPNVKNLPTYDITPENCQYFLAGTTNFTLVQDTMDDLVKNALRMRPDRLIVGEVRGPEAQTMFTAMNTGHDGCCGTVHSNSAMETITRLTEAPMNVPGIMLPALDVIVMQQRIYHRKKGQIRRVTEVAEVTGMEGDKPQLSRIFKWNPRTDAVEPTGVPSKIKRVIADFSGLGGSEIEIEIEKRAAVLEWMKQKNIRNVFEVGNFIQEYYRDPESMLKKIRAEKGPKRG